MFGISVSSVEKLLYSGRATEVCLPAEGEQITILDFHHPLIVRLGKGEIGIDYKKSLNILDGIAYFNYNELKLIVRVA